MKYFVLLRGKDMQRELPLAENPTFDHFEVDCYLTDNTATVRQNT